MPAESCGAVHFELAEGGGVARSKRLGRCHVESHTRLKSRTLGRETSAEPAGVEMNAL
jgi:hypothetical protein